MKALGMAALGRAVAARWPFPVEVPILGGQRMYVDLRSSIGRGLFAKGSFDMGAIQPALDTLSRGMVFVDVGANVGFYSLLASRIVGPSGHVFAFEIDPRPLRVLRKTIRKWGLDNVHVVEAAVADVDGELTFVPAEEHGHNRIGPVEGPGRSVRAFRLDTWVRREALGSLNVLKIDVEGAERLVLDGARETIDRFRPLIVCEASHMTTAFGSSPDDLVATFASLGYTVRWLEDVWTPTLFAKPLGAG